MQDDSAFGEAFALGYTPSGAKIRGGNPMRETWQKMKDWATPKLPFLPGAILPIAIAGGAIVLPFFSPCLSDSELLPETIQTLLRKISIKDMGAGGGRNLILIIGGCITWLFLYWRTVVANRNAKAAEQGVTVDRLAHATKQLAHKEVHVRMGGILGLEQIALAQDTDESERRKIARIFVSFLYMRAARNSEESKKDFAACRVENLDTIENITAYRIPRLDIEAAVNALARVARVLQYQKQFDRMKNHLCNLQRIDFRGLRFVQADLSYFMFANSDFGGAWLREANLTGANLENVALTKVWLVAAKLIDSNLKGVDFTDANLSATDFENAKGLVPGQINQAYYWEEHPPRNLPDGLNPPWRIEKLPEGEIISW